MRKQNNIRVLELLKYLYLRTDQENKKIYRKLALRAVQNEDFFPYTSEKEMFLTCTLQIEYPIV